MDQTSTNTDFGSLKELLLEVGRERTEEGVLRRMVSGSLAHRPNLVRACVWVVDESNSEVLRLADHGANVPLTSEWTHTTGDYRRVPFSEPLIGQAAARRQLSFARDATEWPGGYPPWAEESGVMSYLAAPVVHLEQVLGVIAVFSRSALHSLLEEGGVWLRMFADHAAAGIANARAFQEIDRLRSQLELENEYLKEEVREASSFGEIVGQSPSLKKCLGQIRLVAPTDANVLILGESGTGKELVARAIHEHSKRNKRPMIKVNCASVPHDLFESEFFGHVQGAFTGAQRDRRGRFELADGGTLFLDEIGEIPIDMQGKLLRVLQEQTFERVGDEKTRTVDVRIIAATNQTLVGNEANGRFREDLYYRLSVFPVELTPLRERMEDIPLLAELFLRDASRRLGCSSMKLKRKHILELTGYSWPGNARELQNVMERAVITARCGELRFDLPSTEERRVNQVATKKPGRILRDDEIRALERQNMLAALESVNWKISGKGGAAQLLGLKPSTLASRMKSLEIKRV